MRAGQTGNVRPTRNALTHRPDKQILIQRRKGRLQKAATAFVPAPLGKSAPSQVDEETDPLVSVALDRNNHFSVRQRRAVIKAEAMLRKVLADDHYRLACRRDAVFADGRQMDQTWEGIAVVVAAFHEVVTGIQGCQ